MESEKKPGEALKYDSLVDVWCYNIQYISPPEPFIYQLKVLLLGIFQIMFADHFRKFVRHDARQHDILSQRMNETV